MSDELPFHLQGNFAPVSEERTALEPEVSGSVPEELVGLYVRNGANPVTGRSAHWFLGHGMVHGVRLEGGRAAWYRNRYVRTPYLDDPEVSRISPDGTVDHRASAANTHVIAHAGRILALEEGAFPFVLTPELDTLGYHDYDGALDTAMTAHPKICPVTGELLFFAYQQLPPYLVYYRASAEGELVQREEISVGGPTMMHDFAITERHALFMDLPVVFDLQRAVRGEIPFHWSDDYPARIGIMPREGKDADVKWFDVDPCYVFHGVNAYEDGGGVVFDVCRASEMWRNPGEMDVAQGNLTLHRFRFDLERGTTTEQTVDERGMEFPRVADARVGLRHRYGFTLRFGGAEAGATRLSGLQKTDFETGVAWLHDFGPGRTPSEAVFVPAAGSDPAGDEGWVMTFVYDEHRDASEFVILDAADFGGRPVARVQLPQRVPYGFHGSWIPDSD